MSWPSPKGTLKRNQALPTWTHRGKAITIPVTRKHHLSIPLLPLLLISALLTGLYLSGFTSHHASTGRATNAFIIPPSQFIPPPPYPHPEYIPKPVAPKSKGMIVPNSVHYVYGLKPLGEGEQPDGFPYYAYLAMRSAFINLNPEKMFFHYEHLPTGPWWDLIVKELTLVKTVVPDSILGRELKHFAHKADVIRLLAMKYSGGVYLDIDIFVVKPFDDLFYFPTTLGMQMSPDSRRDALDPQGLCNAVIISAPHSSFIDRWLASYETFDESEWDVHSVEKPWEIARHHPDDIQVLSNRAFFWPMWHGEEIQYTHERNDHDFKASGQYAYHAWESLAMRYLEKLSPEYIRNEDTSFTRLVRPFIGPEDDRVYNEWANRH